MRKLRIIAKGIGFINKVEKGKVIEWSDNLFENPNIIKNEIVFNKGNAPLYRIAFLIENKVKAVLLEKGGRNYHPFILLNDALVPAVAGIGETDLAGKKITIDCGKGIIYEGEAEVNRRQKLKKDNKIERIRINTKIYVNVGYPTALEAAAKTNADGIGLLRTEFIAARTLSKILNEKISKGITIKEAIEKSNEADIIYYIAKHSVLKNRLKDDIKETIIKALDCFGEKEVIIRTFDIARDEDDFLGNRGIKRCLSEGGYSIKILAEAVKEAIIEKKGKCNIGVILPLVSHYSQINTTLNILFDAGLSLRHDGNYDETSIRFGWEMELPAASQNNEIWLEVFKREYGLSPHIICIGTNDLTQFTIGLERNAYSKEKDQRIKRHLKNLYDESDFSVIKQIYDVAKQCKKFGTRVFITGEACSRSQYLQLMLFFGVIPSIAYNSFKKVKQTVYEFEQNRASAHVIEEYVDNVCSQYPIEVRAFLKSKLLQIIQ